jgi:hypothetical protein
MLATQKGEGKSVGGVSVKRVGIQSWGEAGWARARRGWSIEEGWVASGQMSGSLICNMDCPRCDALEL